MGQPGRGTNGDHKDIMSLAGLLDILDDDPQLRDVVARAGADPADTDLVAPPSLRPVLAAALTQRSQSGGSQSGTGGFVLAVTATAREAEDLAAGLGSFLPPDSVAWFPGWETLPHERLSPRSDTVGQRLAVLRRLAHPSDDDPSSGPLKVVVAPVRALLQPQVPGLGELEPVMLRAGDTGHELTDVVTALVNAG